MRVHGTFAMRDRCRLHLQYMSLLTLAILDPVAAAVEYSVHFSRLCLEALLVLFVCRCLHILVFLEGRDECVADLVKIVNARIFKESGQFGLDLRRRLLNSL